MTKKVARKNIFERDENINLNFIVKGTVCRKTLNDVLTYDNTIVFALKFYY